MITVDNFFNLYISISYFLLYLNKVVANQWKQNKNLFVDQLI